MDRDANDHEVPADEGTLTVFFWHEEPDYEDAWWWDDDYEPTEEHRSPSCPPTRA